MDLRFTQTTIDHNHTNRKKKVLLYNKNTEVPTLLLVQEWMDILYRRK